ncbi:MAG: FliH/SctL family protein [Myxococcota bacterium]
MPSFNNYPVFATQDRSENRPRCVFDKRTAAQQSFRTFEFQNLSEEATEKDMEKLRAVAADARAEFDRELERRAAEAERRGQELGLQEAVQIHREERAKLAEKMEGAISAFHAALDRAEEATTRDALRLGILVAERLTRITLVQKPEAVVKNLIEATEKMEGEAEVKVVASPEVASELQSRTDEVAKELEMAAFAVESDDSLQPGDLIIYRGSASIDARVSTRLRKIERSLLAELGLEGEAGEDG